MRRASSRARDREAGRMTRRAFLVMAAALAGGGARAAETCPACGAPIDPRARFCTACGRKIDRAPEGTGEAGAAPAPATASSVDPAAAVVQVIATHDRELTSAYGAIVMGSTLHIDTIFGSAFAVAPGRFVTDAAVVAGAHAVTLRAAGGHRVEARLTGIDTLLGVAFLEAALETGPAPELRTAPPVRSGESTSAIGFPSGGRDPVVVARTSGVVSGLHRMGAGLRPFEDYIQTDAALPDGFAGGPLVDAERRIIGMATGLPIGRRIIMDAAPGVGMSLAAPWVERALAWDRAGRPARPWLGLHRTEADADLRARYHLAPEIRSVIDLVFADSPAARAGLRRGDGFVSVDGIAARDLLAIQERLIAAAPGAVWPVSVVRGRDALTLPVTLAARPDRPRLSAIETLLLYGGLELAPRSDGGLVVTRVERGSAAEAAKIGTGALLVSILVKKDLANAERNTAAWRPARNVEELEKNLAYAWSDFDFFVVLKLRAKDGDRLMLPLLELVTPGNAL
jgi:S1-C subfamily serine protease